MEWEFHVVCREDTDCPARTGCGDDAMVRLCGSSAVKVVQLTDRVRSLEDFDLGLDGTLSEVTRPENHLCSFNIIGNVKVSDGTASTFGGSTLYGGLWAGVENLLCGSPCFLHSVGVGDFGTEFEGEFVGSGGGDLKGLGTGLEFKHGTERRHITVFGFDIDGMDATDGSDPL